VSGRDLYHHETTTKPNGEGAILAIGGKEGRGGRHILNSHNYWKKCGTWGAERNNQATTKRYRSVVYDCRRCGGKKKKGGAERAETCQPLIGAQD